MPVQYASRKMGVTIQAESYKVELAGAHEMDHDPEVLEYYDQPPPFNLRFKVGNRIKEFPYTPDFFVIRKDSIGWEEWKEEEELRHLEEKNPNRYLRDEQGEWRCPPAEEVATPLGFYFKVRSSREINWILQRNLRFLASYWRKNCPQVSEAARKEILNFVSTNKGIILSALLAQVEQASADDIYKLIADEQIYVDLHTDQIPELEQVHVYSDKDTADAWVAMFIKALSGKFPPPLTIRLEPNAPILYDGCPCNIIQHGKSETHLLSEDKKLIIIPNDGFEGLVAAGRIVGVMEISEEGSLHKEANERYLKASKEALKKANERFALIKPVLAGLASTDNTSLGRAMRRWVAKFREAEQSYNCGYIGLLPDYAICGNRIPRIKEAVLEIVDEFIKKEYENHKQKNKREVYGEFENYCKGKGITAIPSYKFFVAAVNNRPLHEQVEKRAGSKAAYPFEPFYWELLYTLPRHGDYPFQITHLDHTQLDIELIDLRTGKNLGRPWLTLLIDSYSRRILAVYLSFDRPSYRSCMMVLRECVYRHQRFPEMVVVDGGKEFHSVYFDSLLARNKCSKATRPKSKSRFGSEMERVFGTTNEEFIHNLEGNTQATKNVRQLTPAVDPKRHAVWTLGELYARIQEWAYEQYDTNEHGGIGQTPAEAFKQGIFLWGRRGGDLITFNDAFVYYTLPTTPKGTAKLDPTLGVKINNIYYSAKNNLFRRNRKLHRKQIPVRYDPFDIGHAYAFVKGKWVECFSQHHAQLRGRTEREIQLAGEELRARYRRHGRQFNITAAKLAAFITSVEGQEALLTQRRKDLELRGVLALMGKSTLELHGLGTVSLESSSVINGETSPATAPTLDTAETPESTNDDDIYEVVIGA
jgi:putative transposase